jgi:hypothetical protein
LLLLVAITDSLIEKWQQIIAYIKRIEIQSEIEFRKGSAMQHRKQKN